MTHTPSRYLVLRALLALTGIVIILLGLNVGLGGIKTLGWQVVPDFVQVSDSRAFGMQDSHVRFLGGFWLGAGLMFVAAARWLQALRPVLLALVGMIVVGGLARVASLNIGILMTPDILQSLALELVGFPMLGLWLYRVDAIRLGGRGKKLLVRSM